MRRRRLFILAWACFASFVGCFKLKSLLLQVQDDAQIVTSTNKIQLNELLDQTAIATTTSNLQAEELFNNTAISTTTTSKLEADDSSASLLHLPPLIIGAAQGTTGTHTMHVAMCCLGIPATHYANDCWVLRLHSNKYACKITNKNARQNVDFGLYDDVYHYKRGNLDGLRQREIIDLTFDKERHQKVPNPHPHIRMFWYSFEMLSCVHTEIREQRNEQCPPVGTDDMARWAEGLKSLIDEVIRWHEDDKDGDSILNVGAINDTPFTFTLPYVIESAKRHRGQDPFLLLLERNPLDWSRRRSEDHEHLLCRIDLLHGYNNENVPPTTSHFDWFECIDRTIRAKEETLGVVGATVDMYEVFTSSQNLDRGYDQPKGNEWSTEDLNAHMAVAFETHQNFWNHRSDLHWNMFEHKTSAMDIALAAHELFSSSGTFEKSKKK